MYLYLTYISIKYLVSVFKIHFLLCISRPISS